MGDLLFFEVKKFYFYLDIVVVNICYIFEVSYKNGSSIIKNIKLLNFDCYESIKYFCYIGFIINFLYLVFYLLINLF